MSELPDVLELSPDSMGLRLSPNEMRILKKATGRTLEALLGEEAEMADRMQAIVWMRLRRDGHPELTWEEAGDVAVEFVAADPTSGGPSTSSPDSADIG